MSLLSCYRIVEIVSEAIQQRQILQATYQHVDDEEEVRHRLAPFDIGSSNPKTASRFQDNVYAYAYTHRSKESNLLAPRVCAFNIHHFISLFPTGETFDETEVAKLHQQVDRFDYRTYKFALSPGRNWFV